MRKYHLILALACSGWTVKAQDSLKTVHLDEVVVTGTKSEVPIEKSGKTIYKLTRKDIDANVGKSVADLLNGVPGVQMDGNFGTPGTNLGYFVRGASSKRTLILIDGVPFNDPSGIDQTYDLRLLDLNQVESIEVLKGGLSTLYGSGAAAGVISIRLKKPPSNSFAGNVGLKYGSFNTINPTLGLAGNSSAWNYLFNTSYKKSDGFSSAQDQTGSGNFDEDGFEGYNVLGKLGYDFSDQFKMDVSISIDDFDTDYDAGVFFDGDNTSNYQQIRVGASPKLKWLKGSIKADIFFSKLDRLFDSPDFFDPTMRFIDEYNAESMLIDLVIDQHIGANLKLIGGINYQDLAYSQPLVSVTDFRIIDPYVTFIFDEAKLNVQVGARLNNHSEYGSNLIYNVNPSYLISLGDGKKLKLLSSYATSFITPSLYQLYGPFGNLELTPEESQSAEGGASIYLEKVTFNAVYFYRKDKDLIDFRSSFEEGNFIGEYFNSSSNIETDGIEMDVSFQPSTDLELSANYSYVRTINDVVLYRVPEDKYGFSASYLMDELTIGVNYIHTGDRIQPVFNNATFEVDDVVNRSFDLVDISSSYRLQTLTISGSINNIFDEEYTAIIGFNTIGRNYSLGVSYDF